MFSKSCTYALRAVIYIAANQEESAAKISGKQVAEALNIPFHFLAKLLQQLTKVQIISASKGLNGGFYLTEENFAKTLGDVVTIIDGQSILNTCVLGFPKCSDSEPCPLHEKAKEAKHALMSVMSDKTLKEIAEMVKNGEFKL